MIVKRFTCPSCHKLLQTCVSRVRMTCPVCCARFTPGRYRLVVKKSARVERINQVMQRSGN